MIIILTGGTGLIGQALIKKLLEKNYKIHLLRRTTQIPELTHCKSFLWPSANAELPHGVFPEKEDYGVIHLAGEPVFQWPWTKSKKKEIYSSRVDSTKNLISELKKQTHPPLFFLSASATGIYGESGEEQQTESSPISDQNLFLQKLCKDWEAEAEKTSALCRSLIFRLGIVLSYEKGFLYEQMKWLKRGVYPLVISKKPNYMSWIALEDLCSLFLWAIENKSAKGVYNAVSPYPVSLKNFYKTLFKQKKISFPLPIPLFLMKYAGGEMTKNLLVSCFALPKKALEQGFIFKKTRLEEVLSPN